MDRSLGWSKCGPDRTGAGYASSPDYRKQQKAWLSLIRRKNFEVEGGPGWEDEGPELECAELMGQRGGDSREEARSCHLAVYLFDP